MATPPDNEAVIKVVRRVGELSRRRQPGAGAVFVSSHLPRSKSGASDSRSGISVPLGRAGAVRRLSMQLGRGTSQHVLVAGKTGSGKSTLLARPHHQSCPVLQPDEVELYLIDFKKGVEFKMYASAQLPHARVIAIESEREFGLSVLQRLDVELRERGDLFRTAGVNDIASFRQSQPEAHCPASC